MKFQSATIAALICAVTASPVAIVPVRLEPRQDGTDTSNDLVDGLCRTVTFIFARGTSEPGNMVSLFLLRDCFKLQNWLEKGTIVGPQVCTDLQSDLGASNVACQGVGSPYDATVADNLLPQDTSPTDIGAATTMFDLANTQCPDTLIVAGGYRWVTDVPEVIKAWC
jgi:cutinase